MAPQTTSAHRRATHQARTRPEAEAPPSERCCRLRVHHHDPTRFMTTTPSWSSTVDHRGSRLEAAQRSLEQRRVEAAVTVRPRHPRIPGVDHCPLRAPDRRDAVYVAPGRQVRADRVRRRHRGGGRDEIDGPVQDGDVRGRIAPGSSKLVREFVVAIGPARTTKSSDAHRIAIAHRVRPRSGESPEPEHRRRDQERDDPGDVVEARVDHRLRAREAVHEHRRQARLPRGRARGRTCRGEVRPARGGRLRRIA